jgi:hypothetical protein
LTGGIGRTIAPGVRVGETLGRPSTVGLGLTGVKTSLASGVAVGDGVGRGVTVAVGVGDSDGVGVGVGVGVRVAALKLKFVFRLEPLPGIELVLKLKFVSIPKFTF